MSVFLAYDIRGEYPKEINEEFAYNTGLACAKLLKSKFIIVGRDCRLSSPSLQQALMKGITDFGVDVVDIGICSTPLLYYASKDAPAIMVTASHDPKQYNGFKTVYKGGTPVSTELIQKTKGKSAKFKGEVMHSSYLDEYVKFVRQENLPKIKVVCDAGNGCSGIVIPSLFPEFIGINMACDGNFPSHDPNPEHEKNLKQLQKKVLEVNADIGIAYDGDCDRVFFVDEKGKKVDPSVIGALLASAYRGKRVIYSINNGKILKETIGIHNFAIPSRIGHFFIKKLMREKDAIFAAEPSGHYYFRENNFCDSGDMTVARVIKLMRGKKLSEAVKPFQKYYNERLTIPGTEKNVKKAASKFKNADKTDGITVELENGWFNLRASNTEPILKLFVESDSKKAIEEIKRKVMRAAK